MNKSIDIATNNWQNIGIMWIFARKEIPGKYRNVFMVLVEKSFGRGNDFVKINGRNLAKECDISRPTLLVHLEWLIDNKFIKVYHTKGFVEGGGKESYSYYPIFPDNGHIYLHKSKKKDIKISKGEEANKGWKY